MRGKYPSDLSGLSFGKLRVVSFEGYHVYPSGYRRTVWNCEGELKLTERKQSN